MRNVIVTQFVSIDGVMEAPGGEPDYAHTGWVVPHFTPELGAYKFSEITEAGSQLLGRITYESFAGAFPALDDEFAARMNAMPKQVVSTTLHDPAWNNTTVIASDVVSEIQRLKAGDGDPILVSGSATLIETLIEHGLVDEWRLQVFPVVLGSGRRLWPDRAATLPLELVGTQSFPQGVNLLTYRSVG